MSALFASVSDLQRRLAACSYLADDGLSTALFLAARLPQPLLLEGEPGVGKSELARTLAEAYGLPFIRLQCYEGLDARDALYEWDYLHQLLEVRTREAGGGVGQVVAGEAGPGAMGPGATGPGQGAVDLFSPRFLIARPLLRALQESGRLPAVLLIDEIDRADEAFEAFLLEFLADYAITIPELGTVRAAVPPIVVITSNRTRELHDALKRRCLYHWVSYPTVEQELAILAARAPGVGADLAEAVVRSVRWLRGLDLQKPPGVAETLAWARAVTELGERRLTAEVMARTLGLVVKNCDDFQRVRSLRYDGVGE